MTDPCNLYYSEGVLKKNPMNGLGFVEQSFKAGFIGVNNLQADDDQEYCWQSEENSKKMKWKLY